MRVLVQRVARAAVHIDGETVASIGPGLLLFVAFKAGDRDADLTWMAEKVAHLRIFEDDAGKMNRSVLEVGGKPWPFPSSPCTAMPGRAGGPASTRPRLRIKPVPCSRNSLTFSPPME